MCALVESLLGHCQGIIHSLEPLEDADGSGSLVGVTKVAARVQAAGELIDWLGTARIALQVTMTLSADDYVLHYSYSKVLLARRVCLKALLQWPC